MTQEKLELIPELLALAEVSEMLKDNSELELELEMPKENFGNHSG